MHTWGTPLKQVQKGKANSEQNHKEIISFLKRPQSQGIASSPITGRADEKRVISGPGQMYRPGQNDGTSLNPRLQIPSR